MENAVVVIEQEVAEAEFVPHVETNKALAKMRAPSVPAKPRKKVGDRNKSSGGITILKRKKGLVYWAQYREAGRKSVSRSFTVEANAKQWLAEQKAATKPVVECTVPSKLAFGDTLDASGNVIEKGLFSQYVDRCEKLSPLSWSIKQSFERLKKHPMLQNLRVTQMSRDVAEAYCISRRDDGKVTPSTVSVEYARICVAITGMAVANAWVGFDPLRGVRQHLLAHKLISDSQERDRRPQEVEMKALLALLGEREANPRDGDQEIPMCDIVKLAVTNAFRRGEICGGRDNGETNFPMLWEDLDVAASSIWMWRKDSKSKETGKYRGKTRSLVPLFPAALEIIMRQPRIAAEIFPYISDSVSQRFQDAVKACRKAALKADPKSTLFVDLRFHDLRHEAISVASRFLNHSQLKRFSGHKSDRHVARYINHNREDITNIAALGAHVVPLGA